MTTDQGDICAVVVTYHPVIERLERVLRALRETVKAIIIVDNGSNEVDWRSLVSRHPSLTIRKLESNQGIAAAQNEGIAIARRLRASYILFLDQDSIPHDGMVASLRDNLARLSASGQKIACVGPRSKIIGGETVSRFERLGWLRRRSVRCSDGTAAVECDYLISSGTLVPMHVIDEVGGMEAELFIDRVDTEWCFRARSRGYRIYGDCAAFLEHQFGEGAAYRIWLGRWRTLRRHAPVRYYYMFRNSIILFRRRYVPMRWISSEISLLFVLFFAFGVFGGLRTGALLMMLKGIQHGLGGISGKSQFQSQ